MTTPPRMKTKNLKAAKRIALIVGVTTPPRMKTKNLKAAKRIALIIEEVRCPPRLKTKNFKAAKRIALIVGVCIACWLSYIIVIATNFICGCNPRELTWIANGINYLSTITNPLLYGLLNKSIHAEILNKLRKQLKY